MLGERKMKNIETLLKEIGVEIPPEQQKTFNENFNKEYKTIADYTKQTEKIANLNLELVNKNALINDLNDKMKNADNDSSKLHELEQKLSEYKEAEKKRLEDEKQIQAENLLKQRFDSVTKDKQFKHEFVKTGVYEVFRKALQDDANKSKADAQIYSELEKDNDWYVNPQEPVQIQSVGNRQAGSKPAFPSFF